MLRRTVVTRIFHRVGSARSGRSSRGSSLRGTAEYREDGRNASGRRALPKSRLRIPTTPQMKICSAKGDKLT
jgi:hypothetical protein